MFIDRENILLRDGCYKTKSTTTKVIHGDRKETKIKKSNDELPDRRTRPTLLNEFLEIRKGQIERRQHGQHIGGSPKVTASDRYGSRRSWRPRRRRRRNKRNGGNRRPRKTRPIDTLAIDAARSIIERRCKERKGFGVSTIPSSTTPSKIRVGR